MKRFLLFFILTAAFAQTEPTPIKGNNRIIVKTDLNKSENFKKIKLALANDGIGISSMDEDIYQIQSNPINVKETPCTAKYIFLCKDNEVVINGTVDYVKTIYTMGVSEETKDFPISYDKRPRTLLFRAFNQMADFAKSIGSVSYLTK